MPKSRKRLTRPTPSGGRPEPGYPSVREHLASRRDVLTFVGASLMGSVLSGCVATLGTQPDPNYYTFRLPEEGLLETTLASGELCQFYVNGVQEADSPQTTSSPRRPASRYSTLQRRPSWPRTMAIARWSRLSSSPWTSTSTTCSK